MPVNTYAAAYLAYFAYIDDALDTVQASDFVQMLGQVPAGKPNGPWTLTWGPAVNDGILAYVAKGADGTYALAFRGTDVDGSIEGSFSNVYDDIDALAMAPWLYPQGTDSQVSAGMNQALLLAIGMTDPVTDLSLLDYLRPLGQTSTLELMVVGHSLGGALAVLATAWLQDQLPKAGPINFTLWPHSFAAPTVWNAAFANAFAATFPSYFAAVNTNDIVPMAWGNLAGVQNTFSSPGPTIGDVLWGAIETVKLTLEGKTIIDPNDNYTPISPDTQAPFSGSLVANVSWTDEAGLMHSMQYQYFPFATGGDQAPPLPNTTNIGAGRAAMPRAVAKSPAHA